MTVYVGCDPSTQAISLVALAGSAPPIIRSYGLPDGAVEARVASAFYVPERFITAVMRLTGDSEFVVGLEAPVVGLGRQTVLKLGQVSGSLIAGFSHVGCPAKLMQSSEWKKGVCGNGGLNKEGVARWVERDWPELHRRAAGDQDTVDAACIARWIADVDRRTRRISDTILA